jgi:hypothetical protein
MPRKDPKGRREYMSRYYRDRLDSDPAFKADHYRRRSAWDAKAKAEREAVLAEFRGGGCSRCPEDDPCCLDAHHLDMSTKEFDVGSAGSMKLSAATLRAELAKCICVCKNCHAKIHAAAKKVATTAAANDTPSD